MVSKCPTYSDCFSAGLWCQDCCGETPADELDFYRDERPLMYEPKFADSPKHPIQLELKRRKAEKKQDKAAKKSAEAYIAKSKLVRKALKNEAKTRDAIVKATVRSGAVLHDGDTRLGDGTIGIDDKYMSKATTQFTVQVGQVRKAEQQNCVLVITTSLGEKFFVASLDKFIAAANEISQLKKEFT